MTTEKPMEHESNSDINSNWCAWYSHQRINKSLENLENGGQVETIKMTALLISA